MGVGSLANEVLSDITLIHAFWILGARGSVVGCGTMLKA
jgi:hypothetical protein